MAGEHISDDDLERYCLGRIKDEGEVAAIEQHLFSCPTCIERAERHEEMVDRARLGL